MSHMFVGVKRMDLNLSSFNTSKVTNMANMFSHTNLHSLIGIENFDVSNVVDMSDMFYQFNTGTSTILNLSSWNTSKVFNMCEFAYSNHITEIHGNFNISNVGSYHFSRAFCGNNIVVLPNFTGSFKSSDTSMWSTFAYTKITDSPDINFYNVRNAESCFRNCSHLVNVLNYDLSTLGVMDEMFYGCTNLVNIPNFNTSKVSLLERTFSYCSIEEIPYLNYDKVYSLKGTFSNCLHLTEARYIFTNNCYNMDSTFADCTNLVEVSELNTHNVFTMNNMFRHCNNLSNNSIQNIVNMCLNSNITNTARMNLDNTNIYSPLFNTIFDNSYYQNRWQELTDAGWKY